MGQDEIPYNELNIWINFILHIFKKLTLHLFNLTAYYNILLFI